jgi:DNA-binding transcriptional MerR regulator
MFLPFFQEFHFECFGKCRKFKCFELLISVDETHTLSTFHLLFIHFRHSVSMKETGIKRLYYSISEVSRLADEEPYVLRYWETEFEQLRPQKNRAGNRVYNPKDIDIIKAIKHLLREKRYTIEGAKEIMRNYRPEMNVSELSGDVLSTELDEHGLSAEVHEGTSVLPSQEPLPSSPPRQEDAMPNSTEEKGEPHDEVSAPPKALHTHSAIESLNGALAKPSLTRDDLRDLRDTLQELLRLLS